MYTVYGIYQNGCSDAIYVGMTGYPIADRFIGHIASGRRVHLGKTKGNHRPSTLLYAKWMYEHSVGLVQLEIRAIKTVADYYEAMKVEREMIRMYKPMLNGQSVSMSKYELRRIRLTGKIKAAA